MRRYLICFILIINCVVAFAQHDKAPIPIIVKDKGDTVNQLDIIDVLKRAFHKKATDTAVSARKATFSLLPSVGYSLSTGYGANLSGNVLFYTGNNQSKNNVSLINASGFIDTYKQRSLIVQTDVWLDDNNYNLVTNFRWLKYPSSTFGLGSLTTPETENKLNFNYVKFYATLQRKIIPEYYVGLGYNLDYHTNIIEEGNANGTISDFTKYGRQYTTTSSGFNVDVLYDKRGNPVNPLGGGAYANITFRQNLTFFGSNTSWQSLIVDLRKYVKTSSANSNVLAFWAYGWFTYGNAPYLDLPATEWDVNGTSGRGYPEGRFRGKGMLYAEAEYRFGILRNGLLGGVLFANGQSFSEYPSGAFKKFIPAAGPGIRIKVNKNSNTNICVDYGVGIDGSRGFFVNLGEGF